MGGPPSTPPRSSSLPSCAGLWIRVRDGPPAAGAAMAKRVDLVTAVRSAAKAAAAKTASEGSAHSGSVTCNGSITNRGAATSSTAQPDRDDYLPPVILPSAMFGTASTESSGCSPSAIARAVADVQGGQVADLTARLHILRHLASQLPVRSAAVKADVADLREITSQFTKATSQTKKKTQGIREFQEDLSSQYEALTSALRDELELRELEEIAAQELPKLWAQLHELRQANGVLRAAAAHESSIDSADIHPDRLAELDKLHKAWTDVEVEGLRSEAEAVEAAVASLG